MGDDVSLPVHPFLFMVVETCLCVGRRVAAGSFYFIDDGLIGKSPAVEKVFPSAAKYTI